MAKAKNTTEGTAQTTTTPELANTLPVVTETPMVAVELTQEEKILKFLEGKNDYVKLNDFLKSLYPIPTFNTPAQWMQQAVSKTLRGLLDGMVKEGSIKIAQDNHLLLGKHYYSGTDQKQTHYNLTTVELYAKI